MSKQQIEFTQEAFTQMVIIRVEDALTHQALVLTPNEAAALKDQLNTIELHGLGEETREREASHMKGLTIYNGHNLPTIDRRAFEAANHLTTTLDLEVRQTRRDDPKKSNVIGHM